jgi:GNAT superfamily N-acetyltransferase
MTVTIRLARPADVQALADIERDAGKSFLAIPDLAWIASDNVMSADDHLTRITAATVWVAEDSTAGVVGFLNAGAIGGDLHIWEAAIRRDFQKRGLGARLIAVAAEHALAVGLASVTLTTFRNVAWNARFYAHNGFEIVEADDLDTRLAGLLRQEADWGMPRRCAMRRRLS